MFACSVVSNSQVASQPPPCQDACEDMAAAKRARTEVVNYTDLALEKVQFKEIGKSKNGSPTVVVLHEGFGVTFNLTPSGWLPVKYGFDLSPQYSRPSFLGGATPTDATMSESLALRIYLDAEQAEFLKEIDQKASVEYQKLYNAVWQPLVTEDTLFGGKASVKIHVCLKGNDLSKLAVVHNDKVDRGEGWGFLKDYMASCGHFKTADVKACLRFKSVWNVDGKAGLKLHATRLVLRAIVAPEHDPFGDDAELLA
jgi:hypothetical protein